MRFGKFLFMLLFGVVFIITLMKVLFFGLMAALVFGSLYMVSRVFGYRRFSRHQQQWAMSYGQNNPWGMPNGQNNQFEPFLHQQSPFEQPLNPSWQKRQTAPAFGRRIEVL